MATNQKQKTARHFLTDLGVLGFIQLLGRFRGLILLPIIAKGLGAEAYGVWTQLLVTVSLAGSICEGQLHSALVRYVSDESPIEDQREYFYSLLFVVTVVAAVVAVGIVLFMTPLTRLILGDVSYVGLMIFLPPLIIMETVNNIIKNMFRALLQIKRYALIEASRDFVRLIAVASILYWWRDLALAVQAIVVVQLIWTLLALGLIIRTIGFGWPRFLYLRKCLQFSLPLIPTYYSSMVLKYSDRFIINLFLGPAALGVYAASYNLAQTVAQLFRPVRKALFPVISRLWDGDRRDEVYQYLTYSMKYYLLIAIPAVVGLTFLGPQLLTQLATDEFGQLALILMPLLTMAVVLNNLESFFAYVLRLYENTKDIALGVMIAAICYIGLNLGFIPRWGLIGAAVSTWLGYVIAVLIVWWLAWRIDQFPIPWRFMLVATLSALAMIPALMLMPQGNLMTIVMSVAVGAAVYFACLWLLQGISKQEMVFLKAVVRGRRLKSAAV